MVRLLKPQEKSVIFLQRKTADAKASAVGELRTGALLAAVATLAARFKVVVEYSFRRLPVYGLPVSEELIELFNGLLPIRLSSIFRTFAPDIKSAGLVISSDFSTADDFKTDVLLHAVSQLHRTLFVEADVVALPGRPDDAPCLLSERSQNDNKLAARAVEQRTCPDSRMNVFPCSSHNVLLYGLSNRFENPIEEEKFPSPPSYRLN